MSNETSEMSRRSGSNTQGQSDKDRNTSGFRFSGRRSDYSTSGRNTMRNEMTKLSPGQLLVKAVSSDITVSVQLRDGEVITGVYSGFTDGFITVGDKSDIEPNDIVAFSL